MTELSEAQRFCRLFGVVSVVLVTWVGTIQKKDKVVQLREFKSVFVLSELSNAAKNPTLACASIRI